MFLIADKLLARALERLDMATFETVRRKEILPPDDNFEEKIRQSFLHQGVMSALNGELIDVRPGYVEIHLPFSEATRQQHGFFHGGMVATVADSASGYAAYTVLEADCSRQRHQSWKATGNHRMLGFGCS